MKNNKYIVITSINEPSEAVKAFSLLKDYKTIVIGDTKTPEDWEIPAVDFISVKRQEQIFSEFSSLLPFNHYARKNIGYLHAVLNGAEIIIDSDDDNIPKTNWGFPEALGEFNYADHIPGFVNIYKYFTNQKIWPRGLPIHSIDSGIKSVLKAQCKVGVWQGLADKSPDVDAIYRLTDDSPCNFENKDPLVLSKGTICPYNSQNTATVKELFPLLFLPSTVSFRFCDILRGLVAQPIMWLYGYKLGFTDATVVQHRNFHDYFEDFLSEIPMYQNCERVVEITHQSVKSSVSISDNLLNSYENLQRKNIVRKRELEILESWLSYY